MADCLQGCLPAWQVQWHGVGGGLRSARSPHWPSSFISPSVAQTVSEISTLCDPMDYSPPGSSVYRILQARILEWVPISSFRGSSWPRDWTLISCISGISSQVLYHWRHLWSPISGSDPIQNPVRGEMELKEMESWQRRRQLVSQRFPQTRSSQGFTLWCGPVIYTFILLISLRGR